jgi:hypothetical protein
MKNQILRVATALGLMSSLTLLILGEYYIYSIILFLIGFISFLELIDLKLKEKKQPKS